MGLVMTTIFLGADHNGWQLKKQLAAGLKKSGYKVVDDGPDNPDPNDDFPVLAARVCQSVLDRGQSARGILICGSGQGMMIAANRFRGIRAVLATDEDQARLARNDDDSNVLALGVQTFQAGLDQAMAIVDAWLTTPFEDLPRRRRRLMQLDQL